MPRPENVAKRRAETTAKRHQDTQKRERYAGAEGRRRDTLLDRRVPGEKALPHRSPVPPAASERRGPQGHPAPPALQEGVGVEIEADSKRHGAPSRNSAISVSIMTLGETRSTQR